MKKKSNSTLQRLTKAELIEELRITEMNMETIEALYHQQIENVKDWEPVRHGRWIMDWTGAEYCSECGKYPFDDGKYHIAGWHSDYCPHCGAKMSPWHEQLIYQNEVTE